MICLSDDFSDPISFADWECIDKDSWDQDGSSDTSDAGLIATSHNTGAELIITMDDFQDHSL